jgi:chemotaxis methyl-accepting protein methylase
MPAFYRARRELTNGLRRPVGLVAIALRIWRWSSTAFPHSRTVQAYGNRLHRLEQRLAQRSQSVSTYFFRNRPQLELILKLLNEAPYGSTVRIAVVGCSKGAEVYSISYIIRKKRPDLNLRITGLDIAPDMIEFAQRGIYGETGTPEVATCTNRDQPSSIFERISPLEREEMFVHEQEGLAITAELRRGVSWRVADAADERLVEVLGGQDIVIANDFLCHMSPRDAEKCLSNVARLVVSGGYLFCSGVDLEVRSKVARRLGWIPITEAIQQAHEGDPSLRAGWPFHYWGLEPFNPSRRNWQTRYASVYRVVPTPCAAVKEEQLAHCLTKNPGRPA